MAVNQGGRPLKNNVKLDGIEACAVYIVGLIARQKDTFLVYLAKDGGVRAISTTKTNQPARPDHELVGTYRRLRRRETERPATTVESVSCDLLDHWGSYTE